MPFNYIKVSDAWKTITEIYQNVGGSWKNAIEGYVNVAGSWKQFWPSLQTPYPGGTIYIRAWDDINNVDNDLYKANTGDSIYGHRGPTWKNSPTAFQYRWQYADNSGGPYGDFSPAETTTTHPSELNTGSPLSRINAWDDRWIVYQVRAQNTFGWSDWFTSANEAHLVKYPPVNLTISISGTPAPGMTLTAVSTWQNTNINTNDQAPSSYVYEWYDSDTDEFLGGDSTYIPSLSDIDRYIRVKVTATNSGGSTDAISDAVGPVVTILAVDLPYMSTDADGYILDNRGGIINGVYARVRTTVYGITSGTSYRVRYRYKNESDSSPVYYLNGAVSTATASWITYTANGSGVGDISSVVVDTTNQVTELYDDHYIDESYYDGSTLNGVAIRRIEIEVSAIKTGTARVIRTLTYGISAAPVPTITATPSTVGTYSDVVFTGSIGGLNGKPAYPTEYFIDFGDGNIDYESFAAGSRNPTYSISHQYEEMGTYTAEISTNPEYTTATTSVTAILAPGAFDIISVTKGLSNGTTRPVTVTWEQSPNATQYEVQIQRQYSNLSGWVTVQTFDASPYTNEPTRTATFNVSPVAKYYQASVRARKDGDLGTAAYSGGGTLASPVYVEAVGTAPDAPTSLVAGSIATTTASISFTAPSAGSAAISKYEWSKDGATWNDSGTATSPVSVSDLTAGASVTIRIRAVNGDDLTGPAGSVTFTTSTAPGAFNITAAVKNAYNSSLTKSTGSGNGTGTGARAIDITWGQSVNADRYEVQIEARDYDPIIHPTASQTWLVLRTLNEAPYVYEPTRTETFNAAFYWQYRVTARARSGSDLATAAYSNGGSSSSNVYYDVTGTAPTKPTIGVITPTKTDASVAYTNPSSNGSASINKIQWSTNNSTWNDVSSSPFTISSLTAGTNYTVYMRAYNNDGLVSPTDSKTFTTVASKPPNIPTSPATSGISTTNITFSWTAPTADSTHLAATGYEYYTSTSTTAPTGSGTAITATTVNFTYTASTSPTKQYFWVRATNADGASAWTTRIEATPTAKAATPVNTVAPTLSTDTTNYSVGSIITAATGTWTGAVSYTTAIMYSDATPVPTDTTNLRSTPYTIVNSDAYKTTITGSYYFRAKVTAYSGANQTGESATAYSTTSARSYMVPTVGTPTVGTATSTGFTITWTSGPSSYHDSDVLIYNSAQDTIVATLSKKTSPHVWTGGAASTTYYAKVKVIAQDSAQTSVTSGFSGSIATSAAPFVTPTFGGSLPTWAATGANGSNFQRVGTTSTGSTGWGWNNGTQTWGGSYSTRGWNFRQNSNNSGTGTARGSSNLSYRTSNSTSRQIYTTSYLYIAASNVTSSDSGGAAAVTWYASPTYGAIRATALGTDSNRYFSTNVSSWI